MTRDRITVKTLNNMTDRINKLRSERGDKTRLVVEYHQPGDSRACYKIYKVETENEYRMDTIWGLSARMTARECLYVLTGILREMAGDTI